MTDFDRPTRRYFELLEALGQAVITTDAAGRIVHWSPAAQTLYGWSPDEVLGRSVLEVTPSEVSRAQATEIMSTLAAGEVWSGEFPVQGRDGKRFIASVTDVPLLDPVRDVRGVVGVSAPSHAPTEAAALVRHFAECCERVWPGQVRLVVPAEIAVTVPASEPHLLQLLSLLLSLYADVMDQGAHIEIESKSAEQSLFAEFGLIAAPSAVYIRIGRAEQGLTYSVLRNVPRSTEPTRYAAALVRMVGGMLVAGAGPDRLNAMHLFLPASSRP
jgi:PAS domain S-box-containing protein